jgi:hypothetical protein
MITWHKEICSNCKTVYDTYNGNLHHVGYCCLNCELDALRKAGEKYSVRFYHMGNGFVVANRLQEENGDFKSLAHISSKREISWRINPNTLPLKIKEHIQAMAQSDSEHFYD